MEELHARSDLPIAIKGRYDYDYDWFIILFFFFSRSDLTMDCRSDKELEPLISFVTFYITDPNYTSILVVVASLVMGRNKFVFNIHSLIL